MQLNFLNKAIDSKPKNGALKTKIGELESKFSGNDCKNLWATANSTYITSERFSWDYE